MVTEGRVEGNEIQEVQGEIIANFIGSGENFGFYPRHKGTSLKG
jgi:hypothetical protein